MNKIFLLIFALLFINQSNSNEYKFSYLSMEDLGYSECHMFVDRNYNKPKRNAYNLYKEDMEIASYNFKYAFLKSLCGTKKLSLSGLDFKKKAESFIARNSNTFLPPCKDISNKDNCFAESKVSNGYYVGEWLNNKQHGKGIQLITTDFPLAFNSTRLLADAIYEGDFVDGQFNGVGKYENGDEFYEGSWLNGERHGYIGWKYPEFYIYGIESNLERNAENLLVVKKVIPFSAAENKGIKKDDIILKIESSNGTVNTNEIGIKAIERELMNLNQKEIIKLYIKGRTLLIEKVREEYKKDELTELEINEFESWIKNLPKQAKDEGIEEDEIEELVQDIINYFYNSYEKIIEINKISSTPEKLSQYLCTSNRDSRCFVEAEYKNIYQSKNVSHRSSYLMGLEHAYNNFDPTVLNEKDGSMGYVLHCRGTPPPYTAFGGAFFNKKEGPSLSKKINPMAFTDEDRLFFGENFYAPCDNMLPQTKFYLFFPELLIKDNDSIAEIEKYLDREESSLMRLDIIDYLEEAIVQKEIGNPMNKTFANSFCDVSIIKSRFCLRESGSYIFETIKKIAKTEGTALYKRNKQNEIIRGKHNFIIAHYCFFNRGKASGYFEPLWVEDCLSKNIQASNKFWKCVNQGKTFLYCDLKPSFINEYEKSNVKLLENIDFNEWVFN